MRNERSLERLEANVYFALPGLVEKIDNSKRVYGLKKVVKRKLT